MLTIRSINFVIFSGRVLSTIDESWLVNLLESQGIREAARFHSDLLRCFRPRDGDGQGDKEIFMYDVTSGSVSRLAGDLSTAFVDAAESNSDGADSIDDSSFSTY